MNTITLIQIGDIHYPENEDSIVADVKDSAMSDGVLDHVIAPKIPTVFRQISRIIQNQSVHGILICGDLTSYGLLEGYSDCVAYLKSVLDLTDSTFFHVVPGNHDVNRNDCRQHPDRSIQSKFESIGKFWQLSSHTALTIEGVRHTSLTSGSAEATIFSINSCIGCGEWRKLPEKIQEELTSILFNYMDQELAADKVFELVGEQLDTPMFANNDISLLEDGINALPNNVVPVILSHHNILPQELLRVDLYTELINSGPFRGRMTQIGRPIIYCHGHIHNDPIEIVLDATIDKGGIITVSAPEIVQGFNLLRIMFNNSGLPLGLEVEKQRMMENGSVIKTETVRVPVSRRSDNRYLQNDDIKLLGSLNYGESCRFNELRSQMNKERPANAQIETFKNILLEAEWLGLLKIEQREDEPEFWLIERRA